MDLKNYQRRVIDEVEKYLAAVAAERAGGNARHGSLDAWRAVGQNTRAQVRLGLYTEHTNGLGEDAPHFCIKVPTGGGKTLLATQILGSIYRTILKERNGAGLVLWVVPSSQIYRDTLRRLSDRSDMYRLMLEHAVSRRIEVWEKHELSRLSPARLRDCLNILVVQLASTNRASKEQLKFFADSGGNITRHFPPEADLDAHAAFKVRTPNLDMLTDERTGQSICKTSIGNLVRLCRPPVILDEGHKATSQLARRTLEDFNASVIVELSATPQQTANIVSRVNGQELLDEEMIKLPMNIATSGQKAWKDVLTQAKDKRESLAAKAADAADKLRAPHMIRPIVLVQVERTGKDQRAGGSPIHALDVKEYLIERLGILESAIAVKSADTDDIEGIDLLADGCPIEWIITKSALQEGWDCPYAYILVSLNNTGSGQSMTQLIGRILRQPFQQRFAAPFEDLNESYIYCLHKRAGEISREVKSALEKEGYEGDAASLIRDAHDQGVLKQSRTVSMRREFADLYRKPFEGKIYLPHFCVKGQSGNEPLDYFRHLISQLNVDGFEYDKIDWNLAQAIEEAKDRFYRISLGENMDRQNETETEADHIEPDGHVQSWLVASLPFEYLSHKQLRRIVEAVYAQLVQKNHIEMRLALVKFVVREHIETFIQEQVNIQTKRAFEVLFDARKIRFYLECAECRFEIPPQFTLHSTGPVTALTHDNGDQIAKSLFDFVEAEKHNTYEREIALVLDRNADVLWWYRNLVGEDQFAIQGYRKNRIRPDFVVQSARHAKPAHQVIVLESKGEHLEGNPDTVYKRDVANYFEQAGKKVTWQQLGENFKDHIFRFQVLDEAQEHGRDWKDELEDMLSIEI